MFVVYYIAVSASAGGLRDRLGERRPALATAGCTPAPKPTYEAAAMEEVRGGRCRRRRRRRPPCAGGAPRRSPTQSDGSYGICRFTGLTPVVCGGTAGVGGRGTRGCRASVVDGIVAGVGAVHRLHPAAHCAVHSCWRSSEGCGYMARVAFIMDPRLPAASACRAKVVHPHAHRFVAAACRRSWPPRPSRTNATAA